MKYLVVLHGVNEGELEIELLVTTPVLYSTETNNLFSNFHLEVKRGWKNFLKTW
jgi:hypothetical protein